jgi:catechol 2,3-dioxygenase-like lactoylglutathione lyase family enzyme
MSMELEALDHVGLTVTDVARSVRWYQEVLGLRRAHEQAWAISRRCWRPTAVGSRCSQGAPRTLRRPRTRCGTSPSARRGGGSSAKAELRDRGIAFEERDDGIAWSVYMPDPDGHLVEITTYEVTRG